MSDEVKADEQSSPEDAPKERLDEEGLPLDRAPTLDDVRGGEGSGLHAIMLTPAGELVGGADSRREGLARGLVPAAAR